MAKKKQTAWPKRLDAAIKEKFGVETETYFNIIALAYVTRRTDDKSLGKKIHSFISKWMDENVPVNA